MVERTVGQGRQGPMKKPSDWRCRAHAVSTDCDLDVRFWLSDLCIANVVKRDMAIAPRNFR